jgi:UDP-glucose 4-epimerase
LTIAWVLGSGGLLGSALCRALRREEGGLFAPDAPFSWASQADLAAQMAAAVRSFAALAGAAGRWEIYWAAGVGSMGSPAAVLEAEAGALRRLLQWIDAEPLLKATPGAFAFASSAGAIYAGSPDYTVTEDSAPAPMSEYGRAKLAQEDLVRALAGANERVAVLVARLSTLYGPGQSRGKPQGLLTHVARCMLAGLPVHVYVPFDTIRDYLAADDAAAAMIAALRADAGVPRVRTKIIASERPVTIAEIIALFRKVGRRAPRVITSASPLSGAYPRRLRFRSAVPPDGASLPKTSLLVGIARVMAAEQAALARVRPESRHG